MRVCDDDDARNYEPLRSLNFVKSKKGLDCVREKKKTVTGPLLQNMTQKQIKCLFDFEK